ncbi:protein DOUBLE-STRAND BREAK FORMATION [Carex rostrata]
MRESIAEAISLFKSRIESKRFTDETLEVLDSILASRDVPLILETRSKLRDLIRYEAVMALRGVKEKPASVDEKLCIVQFFVSAFALIGDVESCLALKYDALVLRESKSVEEKDLKVFYQEWVTFAKDSLDNGFYSIAQMGCDKALKCIHSGTGTVVDSSGVGNGMNSHVLHDIKRLRDLASSLVSSHSVQTQSTQYMKRKAERVEAKKSLQLIKLKQVGSNLFRNGIKKRNAQKFLLSKSRVTSTLPMPD